LFPITHYQSGYRVIQDGEVSVEEFKKAIQTHCTGKMYMDFPTAFKAFIDGYFKTVDIDGT
jgi:hypothetical protein